MAADDDKKWYKDKEKLVPGFIGAAVRAPQHAHDTTARAPAMSLLPKKKTVYKKPRHEKFLFSLPHRRLSRAVERLDASPLDRQTFSRRLTDACYN